MSLRGFSHQTGRSVRLRLEAEGYYLLELGHPWAVVVNLIVTSNHLRATTEHLLARQHWPRLPRLVLRRSRPAANWHLELPHSQQWKLARDLSNYSLSTWGCHFFRCRFHAVPAYQS